LKDVNYVAATRTRIAALRGKLAEAPQAQSGGN
jgi:hypothetical protein